VSEFNYLSYLTNDHNYSGPIIALVIIFTLRCKGDNLIMTNYPCTWPGRPVWTCAEVSLCPPADRGVCCHPRGSGIWSVQTCYNHTHQWPRSAAQPYPWETPATARHHWIGVWHFIMFFIFFLWAKPTHLLMLHEHKFCMYVSSVLYMLF